MVAEPMPAAAAEWSVAPVAEQAEPWLAAPELPPAPETAAVVVHPPVAAADLPPLPDAAASAPFWKKELSFSRKAKAPKAPKTPKVPKAERVKTEKAASAPFWKKELSFGRKAAPPPEVAVADAPTETPPAAPKAPFWKKQMSFSKPSFSLPKRSSGGGKSGGHAVKKLVGLKIGSSQLAAARVSNNGVAEVQQLCREALAPGIVVGGELRDPEALGDALKSFFARNKLPRKGVRLGIASNRIGVRIFDIVGVTEEKQLANAIHFRAQEALPIPLDEAVLDFRVLDESVDEEGQSIKRVLLVVVYRELVERYVSACKKAGITLAGIDLEAFALLRSLAAPVDRGSSALVGVAIGYDRSTFAVSDGRVCEFTRVLEWGGSALNVALARTFDSTPSEVEAIKRSLSLDESTVPPGLTPEQTAQALDAVRRQVQSFARELVSSLQFYQNQPGSLGIGEIVLTGGTTHLPGLAAELERLIGVHVRIGDPFTRVKVSKRLEGTEQAGSLAVAIGLGIED
jgi:type IV pilus assembly protein PilM